MYVRTRVYDFIQRFIDVAASFEAEETGSTRIGITADTFEQGNHVIGVNAGFGVFFTDESTKRRELLIMKNLIEGWRGTVGYRRYAEVNILCISDSGRVFNSKCANG